MLLLIDNYDSFTYNVAHYLGQLGAEVKVLRNDAIGVDDIHKMQPEHIVISPGPCDPDKAGISVEVVKAFAGQIPILGICLGHQAIGQAFGGMVVRARQVMHGKTSDIHHNGTGVFAGLDNPFIATRYHSLTLHSEAIPDCLEVTAWTQSADGSRDEIMGIRHREHPVVGVQFHPESILTTAGHHLLANFLQRNDWERRLGSTHKVKN